MKKANEEDSQNCFFILVIIPMAIIVSFLFVQLIDSLRGLNVFLVFFIVMLVISVSLCLLVLIQKRFHPVQAQPTAPPPV